MSTLPLGRRPRREGARATRPLADAPKLAAFVRRDIRIALSYRTAMFGTALGVALEVLVFAWIGKVVPATRLPVFGGHRVSYMEFVTIGIAVNTVSFVLLYRLATAIRQEQLQGTLESLLCTPTRMWALQLGPATGALVAIPLRLTGFIVVLGIVFGLHYTAGGILPSIVIVLALLPSLWGIGLGMAGAIMTFRRGAGLMTLATGGLGLASGAFLPLAVLPDWLRHVAELSPLTISVGSLREALLGGTGWADVGTHVLELAPIGIGAMLIGILTFRFALRRERRNGTLGVY